jgi:uncharacterized protein YjiK
MTSRRHLASLVMLVLAAATCRGSSDDDLSVVDRSPTAVARANRLQADLSSHDSAAWRDTPLARWILPKELREISGLSLTRDGRLLAQTDEVGKVWEIDYRRGILVKRFALGSGGVHGDFEGITTATGNLIYLLTSRGKLYEFHEGANHADVGYRVYDTGLRDACEFEGVAFDARINSLLFACKTVYDSSLSNSIVIYRWRLDGDSTTRVSRLVVPIADAIGGNDWKSFRPSDITIDPFTGNYVLIASKEHGLIEITPSGVPVFARRLPPNHIQAEGVAITKDSLLIISDEGGADLGMITLYKWP